MFKDNLRNARLKAGLSRKALAFRLNVSQSAVANWENGIREPNLSTLKRIAKVLNVSYDYLLDKDNSLDQKTLDENAIWEMRTLVDMFGLVELLEYFEDIEFIAKVENYTNTEFRNILKQFVKLLKRIMEYIGYERYFKDESNDEPPEQP